MTGSLIHIRNIAIMATLLVATKIDLKNRIIPNHLVIAIAVYGILEISYTVISQKGFTEVSKATLISKAFGLAVAVLICLVSRLISKDGLGMGDVKLLASLGFTLGFSLFLRMLFFTSVSACIMAGTLLATHRIDRTSTLPFAPYISLGTSATFLTDFFMEVVQ